MPVPHIKFSLALVLALTTLLCCGRAAPSATLAYIRGGQVWVQTGPGQPARVVPGSRGALLLDLSPTDGTLAFMTGPPGASVHADRVPALTPFLSAFPYTASTPLSRQVPAASLRDLRARWLRWGGDGRSLIAATDGGAVGWHLDRHQSFVPDQSPWNQTTSLDGEVSATLGSVQSPTEPGVLLYGPGARPGTEVFSRSLPQNLMRALRAQSTPALKRFLLQLDPRAQADDASWAVTPPQLTRDGKRLYFATNAGWGVGSAGSTTFVVFEVDVAGVGLSALGWLGTFSGSALQLLPSPDGQRLLILLTQHVSNVDTPTRAYVVDLRSRKSYELKALTTLPGRSSVVDSACWLGDSQRLAISFAQPRPQELAAQNAFRPRAAEYRFMVLRASDGQVLSQIPGATAPTCGVRQR